MVNAVTHKCGWLYHIIKHAICYLSQQNVWKLLVLSYSTVNQHAQCGTECSYMMCQCLSCLTIHLLLINEPQCVDGCAESRWKDGGLFESEESQRKKVCICKCKEPRREQGNCKYQIQSKLGHLRICIFS